MTYIRLRQLITMYKERRKLENKAIRELVDALFAVIATRDAIWSLGVVDRLFRFKKYKKVLSDYDKATLRLRDSIRTVVGYPHLTQKLANQPKNQRELITTQEIEMLIGKLKPEKLPMGK